MASELLKNRALIQRLKEPKLPDVDFNLASTGFEELFTLPEPKPQELLDIQENVRIQRQQDTMNKARPFLMDESVDFIERENFGVGTITLNKKGPYKGYYSVTKKRGGENITFRDKDKSVVEKLLQEFMDAKGPQGGAAVKTKRKVEGVSEKNLTRLREIISNKAKERGLPLPDFEKYPGRGYPSNTPGNTMAKDLIRRIKKTGTRGGQDFKTVGVGSGSKALTNPLSKPEQRLLQSTFPAEDFNFTKSRFGVDRKVNPRLYVQAVNLLRDNPNPATTLGFQFNKPENYLLTQFNRARLQQLADTGVSEYVPIYKNQKIIGFQDNTETGAGKKFYHDKYKGGASIKTHPNFEKVSKYVDIVRDTKFDHIPVLNKLFEEAGEKVPTFDQLLNKLLDSPGRGKNRISSAIEKHHTAGVKKSPEKLQLLTRDKNILAALVEGRVDSGKMDLETAARILKPEGIQIERGGVKIGAPDIDPEKQIQDLKKYVQRKTLENIAADRAVNLSKPKSKASQVLDFMKKTEPGFGDIRAAQAIGKGAAGAADLLFSAGPGAKGLGVGLLLEADPIITGMSEGKSFGQTARDTFIGSAIDAIPGVNLGSLNEDLIKLADTEEQRVGIQNLIDYQKDYDRFTKDVNAFRSYKNLDQISLDELGLTATDLVNMESSLAERFRDIQTRAPKVYNPDVISLVKDVARKEAEKRKANLEGIQGLIFGDRMAKDPDFIENQIQQILAASTGAQGATDSYADAYKFLPQEQLTSDELDERFNMEGGIMAANGGRIGFADGPMDPKRRTFMKIMAGIASLPVFSKFIGKSEVAKPIVKVAGSSTKMPDWFPDLINKVMFGGTGKKVDADLTVYEPKELPGISIGRYDDGRVFVEGENEYGKKYMIEYEPPGYELIDEKTGKAVKKKGEFIAQEEVPVNVDPDGNTDFDVEVLDDLDQILGPDTRAMEEFATGKPVKEMKSGEFSLGRAEAEADVARDMDDYYED